MTSNLASVAVMTTEPELLVPIVTERPSWTKKRSVCNEDRARIASSSEPGVPACYHIRSFGFPTY